MKLNATVLEEYDTTTSINMNFIQKEAILEYEQDSDYNTMICSFDGKELFVASAINKWIFPNKIYYIKTGVKVYVPENSIILAVRCPWLRPNLEIVTQVIDKDSFITLQVRNIGILPIKILEEELLASLYVVPKLECHIVNIKNC